MALRTAKQLKSCCHTSIPPGSDVPAWQSRAHPRAGPCLQASSKLGIFVQGIPLPASLLRCGCGRLLTARICMAEPKSFEETRYHTHTKRRNFVPVFSYFFAKRITASYVMRSHQDWALTRSILLKVTPRRFFRFRAIFCRVLSSELYLLHMPPCP